MGDSILPPHYLSKAQFNLAVRPQNDHQIVQVMEELDTATARGRQQHSQLPTDHQIFQVMECSILPPQFFLKVWLNLIAQVLNDY